MTYLAHEFQLLVVWLCISVLGGVLAGYLGTVGC